MIRRRLSVASTFAKTRPVNITLEQARTLDAVAHHGSFAKAARALHKVHSAVLYSVKQLEDAVGLPLFDRSGYRSALTPLGRRVLEHCQRLLAAEAELDATCRAARAGHEPDLRIVFDGHAPAIITVVMCWQATARYFSGDRMKQGRP